MRPEILSFLDAYGGDSTRGGWGRESEEFFLSLPFLWKIQFHYSPNFLLSNINNAISKAYASDHYDWRAITEPDKFTKSGNILAARTVDIPAENAQFHLAGAGNLGGFLPGYALNKRADFLSKNLIVNFFETQDDLEHNFFRPWMIAIGIDGLINRNLLCSVTVKQYNNRMGLRKGYHFEDVFPTTVEGLSLDYEGDSQFIEKSITLAFKHYRPITPNNTTEQGPGAPVPGAVRRSGGGDGGRDYRSIAGIPRGRFPGR